MQTFTPPVIVQAAPTIVRTVQTFAPPSLIVRTTPRVIVRTVPTVTRRVVVTRQVFRPPTTTVVVTRRTTLPFTGSKVMDGVLLGIAAIAAGLLLLLAIPPALARPRRYR